MRVEAPAGLMALFRPLFGALRGQRGDVAFFFNRTWHGRFRNKSGESYDVILASLFPSACGIHDGGWSPAFVAQMRGTELGRLIDYSRAPRDSAKDAVAPAVGVDSPYVLAIESGSRVAAGTAARVLFLKVLMSFGRPMVRLLRHVSVRGMAAK
jgi:hypothetical protein